MENDPDTAEARTIITGYRKRQERPFGAPPLPALCRSLLLSGLCVCGWEMFHMSPDIGMADPQWAVPF